MTTFSEEQLISFGNFLLKNYGVQVHSTDGKNLPLYQREVSDADFCNWKEEVKPVMKTPSARQIGDPAWLKLWSADIIVEIHAVHFYEGKVKYDVNVLGDNGGKTRLYNVDSAFIVDRLPT